MVTTALRALGAAAVTAVLAVLPAAVPPAAGVSASTATTDVVPGSPCGPGSLPETGLQGQVPRADRDSGRSQQGYRCNLRRIGQYQGTGATWVQPSYGHCSYVGTFAPGNLQRTHRGAEVLDVSDPTHPRLTASLDSPAMLGGTWETLKVDPVHGRLAAFGVPLLPGIGGLAFDLYDISSDCAHPVLLNRLLGSLSLPILTAAHEAGFSPDGNTFWVSSAGGSLAAIDVTHPDRPRIVYQGVTGITNHGFSFSPDGRTMYGVTAVPAGVQVLDVSAVQDRLPTPGVRQIGRLTWSDGLFSQMTIPFVSKGHPYLLAVDEADAGGVRLLDIADPAHPVQLRRYRLGIEAPSARAEREADTGGAGAFGYDAHYCTIDRPADPTKLACSYFQSGVRLFDIRDPMSPRELGYYNPPAQVGRQVGTPHALVNSAHAWAVYAPPVLAPNSFGLTTLLGSLQPRMNTDWCSSPPQFRPGNQLWVTCQDNGFQVLQYAAPPAGSVGGGNAPAGSTTSAESGMTPGSTGMGGAPTTMPAMPGMSEMPGMAGVTDSADSGMSHHDATRATRDALQRGAAPGTGTPTTSPTALASSSTRGPGTAPILIGLLLLAAGAIGLLAAAVRRTRHG
jgi:hypothetical protein